MAWIILSKDMEFAYDTTWEVCKNIQNFIEILCMCWNHIFQVEKNVKIRLRKKKVIVPLSTSVLKNFINFVF
jgi:hypothetical protein